MISRDVVRKREPSRAGVRFEAKFRAEDDMVSFEGVRMPFGARRGLGRFKTPWLASVVSTTPGPIDFLDWRFVPVFGMGGYCDCLRVLALIVSLGGPIILEPSGTT